MSKVALRLYNREIETLIDQGNIDEAIAHCQHILKTYPKHLETYRLLGKAYLEARRYEDSADIFQRVLLAVPDDFVSHLGMSIICDEQKNLDGAIWHMERAFEISSTNTSVQGELRRLRGRRDGMEPPKIQLTRGALAQIYTKGGEFQQAIAEIKAVLAEDETRSDMKTLLARAYFLAGMRNEATEACIELLKQYPYSLDGNRILVEILPGTSMAQGVDQYKRRIESLDPYLAKVSGSVFETDGIPDNAVNIERFEWDPDAQPAGSWNMPDAGDSSEPEKAPEASGEQIPDWMQQSGWGQSTGEFQDGPVNFDEPEPAAPAEGGELAAAEIPDWLKAMAPPGANASEPASAPADETAEAADLDWLAGLGAPVDENIAEPAASAPAESVPTADMGASDDNQDWLNNLGAADAAAGTAGFAADEGLDWLNNLTPPQEQEPARSEDAPSRAGEALPDWLNTLDESQSTEPASELAPEQPVLDATPGLPEGLGTPEQEMPVDQPPVEPSAAETTPDWMGEISAPQAPEAASQAEPEAIPDWLKDLSGEETEQPLSDLVSGPGVSEAERDESLNWLEGLAEKQGAKPEELITNPSDRHEPIPDWVSKVEEPAPVEPKAQAPTEYVPEKPIEVEAEPMEGELSPLVSGPGTTESEQDDAFKWLENMAAGQGAKSEELLTKPEDRAEQAPGWVGEVESPPTELSALISGPGTSSSEQDDAMLWLESLAQKQGAKAEELITNPEQRTENVPEWVGKVGQVPDEVIQLEPVQKTPAEAIQPEPVDEMPAQVVQPEPVDVMPSEVIQPEAAQEAPSQPEPVEEMPSQPVEEVKPQEPRAQKPDEDFVPGPLSELVSGPGTTEAEQDDALLWLESLAQKQGAKSEELITNPDERKEVAPDWVARVGQEPAPAAESVEPAEPPSVPVDMQGVEPAEIPPVTADAQSDESLAWLQGLAAEEPVAAEQPVEDSPMEQQLPESQPGDQDWLKDLDTAAVDATTGAVADEGLDWLNELSKPEEEAPLPSSSDQPEQPVAEQPMPEPQAVEPAASVGGETSEWLASLEKGETSEPAEAMPWELETPVESGQPETVSEEQPQAADETAPDSTGITDWLKNLDVDDQTALPAAKTTEAASEELPDWLKDTSADEQPPVPEPVTDWIPTEEAPAQPPAEVELPASSLPAPETATPAPVETAPEVSEEVTVPVEEAPSEERVPEPVAEAAPIPPLPQRPPLRQTGMLGGDKDALAVQRARDLLERGGLDTAMSEYIKLIKRGKLLEEVIYDLQEAVYSHPVDVIVWQTLGDAYMRSNRLQDALDAYSKAEELLR